jgi:hypothetical protein
MKLYKFIKQGKQINSAIAETEEEASKICGFSKSDYDSVETEESSDVVTKPTKTRKPRADKGQSRKVESQKAAKSRRKPDYFIFKHGELSTPLSHDKALIELNTWLGAGESEPRIIMGHEIKFTRQISFHLK